jgi:sugar/nucleoside kinase (ribokinase family)
MDAKRMQPDVIGIGHLCYDHISTIDGYPPEDTSKHIDEMFNQPGGAASQAIAAVARLGGTAGYLGNLGDDDVGKYLHADCLSEGIDVSHVRLIAGGVTSTSYVFVNSRNASRTLFTYHDKLPAYEFDSEAMLYIGGAKCIHLDGTMYENAMEAARIARERQVLVSLDGCSPQKDNDKNLALVALTDILIMNETYPCRLMGDSDRERAILRIAELGPKVVISTSGEKGCLLARGGAVERFPAYKIEPVDTTGAGDVFHGAFIFGMLKGYSIEDTIKFSSAVSAINCMSIGGRNGIPSYAQVRQFMADNAFG